jgi:hypothetical protein
VEPIVYENNNCIENVEKYCYCVLHKQRFLPKVASLIDVCISQSSAFLSLLIHSLLIYKNITGAKAKPDIILITEKKIIQWYGHVKIIPQERKSIKEWIPRENSKRERAGKTSV